MQCIVCHADAGRRFRVFEGKTYYRCDICHAKFLDAAHFLNASAEQDHYEKHDNRIDDPAYRKFLSRLAAPLIEKLTPGDTGLDFGCGPGPALADMMRSAGFPVQVYDPFFYPDSSVLTSQYDFITCTEAAEHFFDPFAEFTRLDHLLKSGGVLGVMTCFSGEDDLFENWHYRRDPTHVVFYSERSFAVIAAARGWRVEISAKDVVLMFKE